MTVSSDIKVKLIYSALRIFFSPPFLFHPFNEGDLKFPPRKISLPFRNYRHFELIALFRWYFPLCWEDARSLAPLHYPQNVRNSTPFRFFFPSKFKGRDIQFQNQCVHLSRVHRIKLLSNSSSILVFSQNSSTLHSHFHRCIFSVCISTGLSIFVRVVAYP